MREVYKKISREYFEQVQSGQKTFEYRVDDFECEPGDILVLEEYEYEEGEEKAGGIRGAYERFCVAKKTRCTRGF